jgi:hypothetical protein
MLCLLIASLIATNYIVFKYATSVLLYNEVTSTHKPNGFFEVTSPLYFFLCAM